jgi:hypothetical protein
MIFYTRLAFTSGLALRIKGAAYFTKSKLLEIYNMVMKSISLHAEVYLRKQSYADSRSWVQILYSSAEAMLAVL